MPSSVMSVRDASTARSRLSRIAAASSDSTSVEARAVGSDMMSLATISGVSSRIASIADGIGAAA